MIIKTILYILSIIIISISITFLIIYLNLLNMGYSFIDYVNFIIRRPEILQMFIGILILLILRLVKRKDK